MLQDQGKYLQCLCEVCENFKLLLEGLKKYCEQSKKSIEFSLIGQEVLAYSFCCTESLDCILGKCKDCGPVGLDFQPILDTKESREGIVEYDCWGKGDTKRTLLKMKESVCEKIRKQTRMVAMHKFDATWPWNQFVCARENLQAGELLMVLDFAENYKTTFQNEVQSAHWCYEQVTIHPFACYYICSEDGKLVSDSIVVISEDVKHDAEAEASQ